jgi:hypothetical protein
MRRHRANTASTRNNQAAIIQARADVDNIFPTHEACAVQDVFCFAALADAHPGTMYTDLTGAFPVRSFKNMQYIFVAYIYDLNAIVVRPMPARTDAAFITAFTDVFDTLRAQNYQPILNVMDNECSKAVERHIRTAQLDIQLVPPHNHRVNAAERAIGTFKAHFVAALATVDMNCPLQLWDEFLPQVELTLNLLRFSRRNPLISANHELYGPFDFAKTPLAPLGTKALITMHPKSARHGRPTPPMATTLARLPSTTVVSVFISQPRDGFGLLTLGGSIRAIAKSLSFLRTTPPCSPPRHSSRNSAAPSRLWHRKK